jgi:hypothetical protein
VHYFPCNTCGRRADARVIQPAHLDLHLCDPCLRATLPDARTLPPRSAPTHPVDRFFAAWDDFRAEELREPTAAEFAALVLSILDATRRRHRS